MPNFFFFLQYPLLFSAFSFFSLLLLSGGIGTGGCINGGSFVGEEGMEGEVCEVR